MPRDIADLFCGTTREERKGAQTIAGELTATGS
jgi:hypothetical protein